ncbi:MAG: hypothetical protein MJ105_07835 [Lachnospiraceae bacterium]|nr:hypothetical protein [Lachnospiraceae bacterium]
MSRNFIKGGYVVMQKTDAVSIDNNEAFQKRIEELMVAQETTFTEEDTEGFSEGLDALQVAELVSDEDGGGLSIAEAAAAKERAETLEKEAKENSSQMIDDARQQAQRILNEANAEADQMRQDAFHKGHEEGSQKGYEDGLQRAKEAFAEKERALEEERNALHAEYEAKCQNIEMTLVDTLTDIYSHVLSVTLSDEKDLVVKLLHKTMQTLDTGKHYLIHVPKASVASVREKKSELSKQSGIPEESIEIIEDNTLPENGCLIESDSGIYDCSLGTQLELLGKQLKLISFEKEGN